MASRHRGGSSSAFRWAKETCFACEGVSAPFAKVIMLVLADYVDERWSTFLGQARLAEETDVSERTVRTFLSAAETAGFLCRASGEPVASGRGREPDRIHLHVDGSRDLCPCDQPEAVAGRNDTTNRQDEHDQPARRRANQGGAPLIGTQKGEPTSSSTAVDTFAHFWDAWPKRNGKKLHRAKALAAWGRLTIEQQRAAWRGAKHYADASERGLAGAMDAFRWLQGKLWEEWQEPAVATRRPGQTQGNVFLDMLRDETA